MSLVGLLKDTCTFQLNTPAQDSSGQKIESWADVVLLTSLKCRIEPIGGGAIGTPTKVYESATHTLFLLKPATPTITTKDHRVVISTETYNILLVQELCDDDDVHHLEIILEKTT